MILPTTPSRYSTCFTCPLLPTGFPLRPPRASFGEAFLRRLLQPRGRRRDRRFHPAEPLARSSPARGQGRGRGRGAGRGGARSGNRIVTAGSSGAVGDGISRRRRRGAVVPVHVPEVSGGVDDVADAPLELFRLGESAVGLAVPEDDAADAGLVGAAATAAAEVCGGCGRRGAGRHHLDYEDAPGTRLQGDFAEGGGKSGDEFLGELGRVRLVSCFALLLSFPVIVASRAGCLASLPSPLPPRIAPESA